MWLQAQTSLNWTLRPMRTVEDLVENPVKAMPASWTEDIEEAADQSLFIVVKIPQMLL